MIILSIDVGIKNLAMCLIDSQTKKIQAWEVSGVPPKSSSGLFPSLKKHLDARPFILTSDTVIIEKQPEKNHTIKSVEHFLHTYFLCHDQTVVIWDARHKIPDISGPGRTQYIARKKASVERCRAFLEQTNAEWIREFDRHKKKDDLADTCMQALSYMDRAPTVPVSTEPKKQVPRKPTEHQRQTRYSRANLAYLYKKGEHMNKRFEKDLARYYSSVDELMADFCLAPQ
jgi:hypothetical protein